MPANTAPHGSMPGSSRCWPHSPAAPAIRRMEEQERAPSRRLRQARGRAARAADRAVAAVACRGLGARRGDGAPGRARGDGLHRRGRGRDRRALRRPDRAARVKPSRRSRQRSRSSAATSVEHRDIALAEGAEDAPAYHLLSPRSRPARSSRSGFRRGSEERKKSDIAPLPLAGEGGPIAHRDGRVRGRRMRCEGDIRGNWKWRCARHHSFSSSLSAMRCRVRRRGDVEIHCLLRHGLGLRGRNRCRGRGRSDLGVGDRGEVEDIPTPPVP